MLEDAQALGQVFALPIPREVRSSVTRFGPRPAVEALGWAPRRAGEWAASVSWPVFK